jgi:hypothetical protein
VLRPYWYVKLYLNQTYPGSVKGLTIFVWANSGEVFLSGKIAYGGDKYDEMNNTPPSYPSENSTASVDISTAAIVAAVATVAVIAASVLFIKKRSK